MDAERRREARLRVYRLLSRRMTPEEKARAALELMSVGMREAKDKLRAEYPDESEEQIVARYREQCHSDWLAGQIAQGFIVRAR